MSKKGGEPKRLNECPWSEKPRKLDAGGPGAAGADAGGASASHYDNARNANISPAAACGPDK